MRAVVCKEFGPPEKLVVEEVDDPRPGPGEILVNIRATAIVFPDTLVIEDKYQFRQKLPFIPGGEAAGEVAELGEGVDGFSIGDLVMGSLHGAGGFAEKIVLPAALAEPVLPSFTPAQATGLMYGLGTCLYGLKYRGRLAPGETLLVLGASGHLGLGAIELGKLLGARVIAAASSAEKLAACQAAGADDVINYSEENLKERAKELTGGVGVDVVFDGVGGDYAEAALRAMAWNGRFLVIGFPGGIPRIPLNLALLKSCEIVGVFTGGARAKDPEALQAVQAELEAFVAGGQLQIPISRSYGLDEVPQALRDMLERKVTGKIVFEP
ncbi:MAG: NADPH:quinone oxidoreductase family protein [Myxococcota bacterium]|jgi:NADPH:quinone reductase|nr:NADPH:quinone oxidoreductase family protein [Myxococcota bacterium]